MPFIERGFGSSGAGNSGLRRIAQAAGMSTSARERERRAVKPPEEEPTPQRWIEDAADGYCAMCGRGPWLSVVGHVVRAHGMTKVDLANAAGLTLERAAEVFSSPETRAKHSRNGKHRWTPDTAKVLVAASAGKDKSPRTAVGAQVVEQMVPRLRAGLLAWEEQGKRRDYSRGARKRWASWTPEQRAQVIAKRNASRMENAGHGEAWVAKVREMRASGMTQRAIAEAMGVTQTRISQLTKDMPKPLA